MNNMKFAENRANEALESFRRWYGRDPEILTRGKRGAGKSDPILQQIDAEITRRKVDALLWKTKDVLDELNRAARRK